jgi:hypothetical protein
MARIKGPRKVQRYTAEFKLKAVKLRGWAFNPPCGCQRPWPRRLRGPSARIRDGVSVTRSFAGTEGSRPGTRCWVAVAGVSVRGERGRASAERPRTRGATQKPSRRDKTKSAPSPRGKKRAAKQLQGRCHRSEPAGKECGERLHLSGRPRVWRSSSCSSVGCSGAVQVETVAWRSPPRRDGA